MTDLSDERAAEAIEVLGRWICLSCREEMQDSSYCDACCWLYCPCYGTPSHEECAHLIVIADPSAGLHPSPYKGMELPHPAEQPEICGLVQWPEADLQAAFGEVQPLLEAYEDNGFTSEPNDDMLWSGIQMMLAEYPGSWNRFVPDSPGSDYYHDAFFEDPDTACAKIGEIIGRLCAGFARLANVCERG